MCLEPIEAVQLWRSLRFRGATLYRAAATTHNGQHGAAAIFKYRITTSSVKQETMWHASTCLPVDVELTATLYVIEHAHATLRKTARVYVATIIEAALSAVEKGQKVRCGREVVHKIADTVEMGLSVIA